MTTSQELADHDAGGEPVSHGPITKAVVGIVMYSARMRWLVIGIAAALTIVCGLYVAHRFADPTNAAINTNTDDFISAKVPWRQDEIAYSKAFPDQDNTVIVVVDGKTPELAEQSVGALYARLQDHPDLFKAVVRPDGGPFFAKNGLLFQSTDEVKKAVGGLQRARPVLGILASDPSLRGIYDGLASIPRGVANKQGSFDQFKTSIVSVNAALADILDDKPTFFSWQNLFANGEKPSGRQLRKFIQITPVLDYTDIQPGAKATDFIRKQMKELKLDAAHGTLVRITGQVPIADAEFSTVLDGFGFNGLLMVVAVIFIVYAAVRSFKLVAGVLVTVFLGLVITFAAGLLLVHQLNVLSIAFAVLFVGIGVDFGIQFSVRFKAELYDQPSFDKALRLGAQKVGRPLALAAFATMAGFFAFLPTSYSGVADLGEIAGTGMLIAFVCSITVLPALLSLIRPPAEREPVGYKFLAPVDDFIEKHRYVIIIGTLAVALAGTPLLRNLKFDFNPLNLDDQTSEAVSTFRDINKDPDTDSQTINVLEPDLAAADKVAEKLRALSDVARVTTLSSLVPTEQEEKLAVIGQGKQALEPVLNPQAPLDPPTDEETVQSIRRTASAFATAAANDKSAGAVEARRFSDLSEKLAAAKPMVRARAVAALVPPLKTTLSTLRDSLQASKVTTESVPESLRNRYISPTTKQARVEAAPKGDPNDNANMIKFAEQITSVAPHAAGQPVTIQGAGATVQRAFIEAGVIAIGSIFIILWIVLKRVGDVLLTLVPLLLAGLVTLEITVLIGMPLNFANIIALPLLLGLGVAFKIYFVMAWRAGTKKLLQSSLTRAVFWSALTTATAFGSLWASHHPGTSSMGQLMALSLVTTLAAAILFQPALMGPPRKTHIA